MHATQKIVIAHRGASGYLPEHTLASKSMAYAMGADFVEQDVVLTKDGVPVVLHDVHLDTVTNVATMYPDRARDDGRFYTIDFRLREIRNLNVHERTDLATNQPVYPARFPPGKSHFHVPTLAEEIELIQGLNVSTRQEIGIYPELKSPAWHRQQGYDISRVVLDVLNAYGYKTSDDKIYVQCFDAQETLRLRVELKTKLKLVQLIGENNRHEAQTDFDHLRSEHGIAEIAEYANAIGAGLRHVVSDMDQRGEPVITPLVQWAHARQLQVHTYTLRADDLPEFATGFDQLMWCLFDEAQVDGVFTDFPDRAVSFLRRNR